MVQLLPVALLVARPPWRRAASCLRVSLTLNPGSCWVSWTVIPEMDSGAWCPGDRVGKGRRKGSLREDHTQQVLDAWGKCVRVLVERAASGGLGTEVIAQAGWVAVVLLTCGVLSKCCCEGQGQQSMCSVTRSINSICHQHVGLLFPPLCYFTLHHSFPFCPFTRCDGSL